MNWPKSNFLTSSSVLPFHLNSLTAIIVHPRCLTYYYYFLRYLILELILLLHFLIAVKGSSSSTRPPWRDFTHLSSRRRASWRLRWPAFNMRAFSAKGVVYRVHGNAADSRINFISSSHFHKPPSGFKKGLVFSSRSGQHANSRPAIWQ